MSRTIPSLTMKDKKAFTIVEALFMAAIATFVMLSVWGVYMMSWQWYAEIIPRLDLEKAARLALLTVIEGSTDSNAGTYTVNGVTYTRRNGIAWATAYPTISSDKKTITYKLDTDSSAARQFYYGTYNGKGYIFYKNNNGTVTRIESTKGISNIRFSKFVDKDSVTHDNIIQIVATADADIYGTRKVNPYHVSVVYTDTVHLRNAL